MTSINVAAGQAKQVEAQSEASVVSEPFATTLRDLTVEVSGGQELPQELDAVHLGLGAASEVIAAPSSPDRPANTLHCPQDFVPSDGSCGVRLAWFGVVAVWDDRGSSTGGDGVLTLAGIENPAGSDAGDLPHRRYLVKQFGQHRGVADLAGGELRRPDFQRLLVDPDVDLPPDAPLGTAMLAGVPLAVTLDLDAGAVHCPAGHCKAMSREGISRCRGPFDPQ